jgi:methylated-DNA-[protein]-cysteine S-methyltransferase
VREVSWATIETPAGPLSAACSEDGLAGVRFGRPPAGAQRRDGEAGQQARDQLLARACAQLAEYFAGHRRAFDLPVDWAGVSGLRYQVLSVLGGSVGYGETITYGGLARRAGVGTDDAELPARAIGRIMGSNPVPVVVPCHRVVAGTGLGGFSGGIGPELKRWLLIFEGALPPTLDWSPAGPPG